MDTQDQQASDSPAPPPGTPHLPPRLAELVEHLAVLVVRERGGRGVGIPLLRRPIATTGGPWRSVSSIADDHPLVTGTCPMPGPVLIDQIHVSFFLPEGATREVADAAASALDSQEFRAALQAAVRSVLDADPALARLSVTVDC